MGGPEVTRRLAEPGTTDPPRVVLVTTFDPDEYVHPAIRYGACGFILNRSGPMLLVEAAKAAASGDAAGRPHAATARIRHAYISHLGHDPRGDVAHSGAPPPAIRMRIARAGRRRPEAGRHSAP